MASRAGNVKPAIRAVGTSTQITQCFYQLQDTSKKPTMPDGECHQGRSPLYWTDRGLSRINSFYLTIRYLDHKVGCLLYNCSLSLQSNYPGRIPSRSSSGQLSRRTTILFLKMHRESPSPAETNSNRNWDFSGKMS